mgnify:FL=1|tara:strand:+ start:800 stop:1456 length:657 start_codon:yes stop_codon:yes gene_type:complete
MTEEQLLTEPQTEEGGFNPDDISEKIIDHIGIYENAFTSDECDELISKFNTSIDNSYTSDGKHQFDSGIQGRDDFQFFLEHINDRLAVNVMTAITKRGLERYMDSYPELRNGDALGLYTVKMQRTDAGGGYHVWHSEDCAYDCRDRVVVWMVYLNDVPVENGGATEFIYQKLSIQPKKGTLVLWPATYTHTHRGGFLTGEISKYIATGWYIRLPRRDN